MLNGMSSVAILKKQITKNQYQCIHLNVFITGSTASEQSINTK